MKKMFLLISMVLLITSCFLGRRTTDEIFVGLWKCTSIVETNGDGKDIGIGNYITKYDGTIKKIEGTKEGYYFFLSTEMYSLSKINDTTLSGDGFTLTYNVVTNKLTAKNSMYISISNTTMNWHYEFYKQK